jgi:hypothetical protein
MDIVPVNFRSLRERDFPAIKPYGPLNGQLLQIRFAQFLSHLNSNCVKFILQAP